MRVGEAAHMPAMLWNKWAGKGKGKGSVQLHSSTGFFTENRDILNWCSSCFKTGTWVRKLMQLHFHPCFQLGKSKICTLFFFFFNLWD